MTDNTPTTKQDEGGLALTPFEKDGFDRHVIALATDYMPRIRRWQAEMERSFDALKEHARGDHTLEEAAMGTGYVAETLETAGDLIERLLAKLAAPATPPHNEDGVRKLAERLHQAADDIVSGETIFSDRVHGLLWEAADALSRQALGDIPSG